MQRREFFKILGASGLGYAFASGSKAQVENGLKKAELVFLGDTLLGGYYAGIYGTQTRLIDLLDENDDPGWLFSEIKEIWKGADLVLANLEGPITPRFSKAEIEAKMLKKDFPLRQHERTGEILHSVGIDVVSLANNHSFDFNGEEGLRYTLEMLGGLKAIGAGTLEDAYACKVFELNGLKIGISAMTDIMEPGWMLCGENKLGVAGIPENGNYAQSERLKYALKRMVESEVDFKVVFLHAGPVSGQELEPRQKELVKFLLDSGVEVVVGCHSHMKQPVLIKNVNGKTRGIGVYGLGNFIFGGKQGRQGLSCIAILKLCQAFEDKWIEYQLVDILPNAEYNFKPKLCLA